MAQVEEDDNIRPVNSHAAVHIGRDEAGEEYNVYDADTGDLILANEKVAPQGTIYVGAAHAGSQVRIEPA